MIEKGEENISEDKIAESFPNLGKKTEIQIQEAQSPIKSYQLHEVYNKTFFKIKMTKK